MVRFPEQDPRELPKFNDTSTQQRWRTAQTKALTARRAWKTTQMTVSALCSPFKTFLMRQYGEDFITEMTKEYEGVDITNPNSAAYNTHISVLTGPKAPDQPPSVDDPDYETKIAQYETLVEEAKLYLGMQIPDIDTASRIVNLVVKMEQYRRTAEKSDSEAIVYAIMSLAKGETPTPAMLRHVSQSGISYDSTYPRGKKPTPIDFWSLGVNSDDPLSWRGNDAFAKILYIPWLGIGENNRYKGELIATEYKAYSDSKNSGATRQQRGQLWSIAFNAWAERAFGIKRDNVGFYTPTQGGGKMYLGPMVMFYAKSYGRTGDALTFWSTHSKYRVNALDLGVHGVATYMYKVDAQIGAPSQKGAPIAFFPPRTPTGVAIATTKDWYPYLMDVETGNNPQIDNYIKESVSSSEVAKAGSEFMKQPQSSRDRYRYMVVTRTVLAFPGSVLYSPDIDHSNPNSKVSKMGIDAFRSGTPEERFQYMYADLLYKTPTSDLSRNYSNSREKMKDWLVRLDDASEFVDRNVKYGLKYDSNTQTYIQDWETPFNWSKFFDYKMRTYNQETKQWEASSSRDYIKQIILGIPGPHKDARVITTVDVVLVPEHFETAIRQIEARMREIAGQYVDYTPDSRTAGGTSKYWKPKIAIKEWQDLSNTLIALTSGHWAVEGSWTRKGAIRGGSYNSVYGTMGIPMSSQRALFGIGDSRRSISGSNSGYKDLPLQVDNTWNAMRGIITTLQKYGVYDLSGIKVAYSGSVNDRDDIVGIMSQFKKAYPGVSELIMPDTADIGDIAETARRFHANVTSVTTGKIVNIPGIAEGEWGTYMVRRIPIDTQGVSGKRYSFAQTTLNSNVLEFATNDFNIQVPGGEGSLSAGAIVGVGGIAIAGMLAYAAYEAIGN
jgi:hypothetical protein